MFAKLRDVAVGAALVATGVVLAPVAGHAAGTLMTLVDSDSATQAQVDGAGSLRVGDGTGPLTVDGTVVAKSAGVAQIAQFTQAAASSSRTAAGSVAISAYRHQRVYIATLCSASNSKPCDTATVEIHVGSATAPLAAVTTLTFGTASPGIVTPRQTRGNDYLGEKLYFFVKRGANPDLAVPHVNVLVYAVS